MFSPGQRGAPRGWHAACGTVVSKQEPLADCGRRIFDEIIAVASGQQTSSEVLDYGDNEFTPWQLGAVY